LYGDGYVTNEHVLIIDTNADTRRWIIAQVLQPAGYIFSEASNVDEAAGKLPVFKPHIILVSLTANVANVLDFVRRNEAATSVIVYTSSLTVDVHQAVLHAGARDLLVKPFTDERLARAIERVIRDVRVRQERDNLREQTEQQEQEFNALYTVSSRVAALLDLEEILGLVVSSAVNLTGAEEGTLMLLDQDTGELYLRASRFTEEAAPRKTRVRVTDTLMGRVVQTGRPIMMSTDELVRVQSSFLVKAILSVPLLFADRVTGVLSVDNKRSGRKFNEHEVHLLSTLADSAAIAIEHAQLFEEVQRRANELAALIEIDRHISATLDLTVVLERIGTHAQELLKADDTEVYLLEPDGQTLRAIVALGNYADQIKAQPLIIGQGIVGAVAQSGVAEIVNDTGSDPRSAVIPNTPTEPESLVCAPLIFKGKLLGVMTAVRNGRHPAFRAGELDFLKGLAGQAAIAIENARLYAAERQRIADLTRTLEQQRELDRMRREFIQNISHELRTPLAIVRGYAELLDNGELGALQPEQQASVTVMARRARMLSKMLDDLLAILTAETGNLARNPIDLAQLVDGLITDFQAVAWQNHLTIDAELAPTVPLILGDAIQLRRVVDNLLSNAAKFTTAGGRIMVRLYATDEHVALDVADTGIGIPAEKLPRIFDRFYQVDGSTTRRYGGVGLGLALVKEIVESHGGSVAVESEVGQGTTFHMRLPIDAGSPRDEQPPEA
jgi:signal transduction histidine kinase/DNA-binding response OmpR family regulator/putative methionine-R-sulfoxide reductase with GAF domain